jgi:hypothetical protein
MVKSIYLNLEDDVAHITAKLKRETSPELVLVVPKKSQLFSDSINLRLLKKQADLLGKKVSIMTMDEMGQAYAKEAGFGLKHLAKTAGSHGSGDIRMAPRETHATVPSGMRPRVRSMPTTNAATDAMRSVTRVVKKVAPIIPAATVAIKDTVFPTQIRQPKPNLFQPQIQQELAPARRTSSTQKMLIGFVTISLVIILLLVFVILPSATITVYAKTQSVSRDIDVTVSPQVSSPDQSRLTLPSTRVQKELVVSDRFDTIGKKDLGTKAQGGVKIFNLSGKPLNLRAGTTTLTAGEKTYQFTTDQNNIKPTPNTNSSPNNAEVIATAGGESFNLPAGTRLEISNQVFGNQPQVLFAIVDTPVVGGSSRFSSIITEEDLTKSKEALTNLAIAQLREELKVTNILLPEKAFTVSSTDYISSAQVGAEVPTFTANQKVVISGLGFNALDLATMMRQRIIATLGRNVNLQDSSQDSVTYTIKDIDFNAGSMRLTVHYESKAIGQVQLSDVTAEIAGKSKEQASEILLANDQIDHIDIVLAPSWQKTIPSLRQKITIELK